MTAGTDPNPPVLCDPADDAALAADGVTTWSSPLVDPVVAAELRTAFGRVHGWSGDGWYNAFNDDDLEIRTELSGVLAERLHDVVCERFVGFEPFFWTYLVKWRGDRRDANFLFLHQDWMYVDESDGARSYVVFLALEDIGADNGRLHMLPAGNRLDGGLRGSRIISPWLRHDDLLRSEMVPLHLRAGQAAVWDGAIVHCSEPNRSPTPRVGVGIWLRPAARPLVHYRRVDERWASRHEISQDFFAVQTPGTLDERLGAQPEGQLVPIAAEDLDEVDLRRRLDERRTAPHRSAPPGQKNT